MKKPDYDREVFLVTAKDDMEAGMIESLMNEHSIPVMRKYGNLDGYRKTILGTYNVNVDIYVPSKLFDKAKEILESTASGETCD